MSQDSTMPKNVSQIRIPVSGEGDEQSQIFLLDSTLLGEFHVGFTGTRKGMSLEQLERVTYLVIRLTVLNKHNSVMWAHDGDCEGSDTEFHKLAEAYGYKTHGHPPVNKALRAYNKYDRCEPPKAYGVRDADIVRCCSLGLLIATPHRSEHDGSQVYSGTWKTVRIARKRKVPYIVVDINGRMEGGNGWKRVLGLRKSS